MESSLKAAKQQLRSLMKARLAHVRPESVATQSRVVFETLTTIKPYTDAQRISVFLSMPAAEIQTDAIVRHAIAAGKQVYIPYLHKSPFPPGEAAPLRVMDMVRLEGLQDYESLQRDKWGIPSIDPATVNKRQRILGGGTDDASSQQPGLTTLDLIVVPGVAFDVDPGTGLLRRLGHGKGFYDFFIRRYSDKKATVAAEGERRPALLYGLGLSEQFLPPGSESPVPVGEQDKVLDGLILGDGQIKRSSDGSSADT